MTDMTVGFLFIVIILLAFFATQIAPEEMVPKRLLDERDDQVAVLQERLLLYKGLVEDTDSNAIGVLQQQILELKKRQRDILAQLHNRETLLAGLREELDAAPTDDLRQKILELRSEIERLHALLQESETENPIARYNALAAGDLAALLGRIRTRVKAIDDQIDVEISLKQDALQFRGDGLFARAQDEPSSDGRDKMQEIAQVLTEEIGCFTLGITEMTEDCNPNVAVIDAIQIEGHTDSDGSDTYNMALGARRGASIYTVMVAEHPGLLGFRNLQSQPVLSVASYGEGRPIADESHEDGKDANRRIDVRFIMFSPAREDAIPLGIDDLSRVRELLARDILGGSTR
ncbi:OmpA family protein [Pacificispira sp.]|uniref:OmpA family protein n=1 Tax=Pacificispira sp. TaxID=2888761 RepID=UPI003B51BCC8